MKGNEKDTVWIASDLNFKQLFQEKKYEELIWVAKENQNLIKMLRRHKSKNELQKSTRFGMLLLSYFERSVEKASDLYSVFMLGKLKGSLEIIDEDTYTNDQNELSMRRAHITATKHLDKIIKLLELHGSMSQAEMCERLELQKSTLSEAMKKIRETKLVQASEHGKFKVYHLTDEGIRYAKIIRTSSLEQQNVENTIKDIEDNLHNPLTRDQLILSMKKILEQDGYSVLSEKQMIKLYDKDNGWQCRFKAEQRLFECNTSMLTLVGKRMENKEIGFESICNNGRKRKC